MTGMASEKLIARGEERQLFGSHSPREHPNHICQTKEREDSPVSV